MKMNVKSQKLNNIHEKKNSRHSSKMRVDIFYSYEIIFIGDQIYPNWNN